MNQSRLLSSTMVAVSVIVAVIMVSYQARWFPLSFLGFDRFMNLLPHF